MSQSQEQPYYGEAAPTSIIYDQNIQNILTEEEIQAEKEAKRKLLLDRERELEEKLLLIEGKTQIHVKDDHQTIKSDQEVVEEDGDEEEEQSLMKKRAWQDDDDELKEQNEKIKISTNRLNSILMKNKKQRHLNKQEYQARLDSVFTAAFKNPSWNKNKISKTERSEEDKGSDEQAGLDVSDDENTSNTLKSRNFLKKSKTLNLTNLDIRKCSNDLSITSTRFKATCFHPNKQLFAAVTSDSRRIKICHIDGQENKFINSINFFDESSYGDSGIASLSGKKQQNHLNSKSKLVDIFFDQQEKLYSLSNFINKKANNRWNCNILSHNLVTGQNKIYKNVRGLDSIAARRFEASPDRDFIALCNNQPAAQISVVSLKNDNLQVINSLRQGSKVVDMKSFKTSTTNFALATLSDQNEVFFWDLRYAKRCTSTIKCDQIIRPTRLAINHNGQKLAIGGHTGYVSLYDLSLENDRNLLQVDSSTSVSPVKEFSNLTTAINSLEFCKIDSATDILSFSSNGNWANNEDLENSNFIDRKRTSEFVNENNSNGLIKIAHTGSNQVYSSFPSFKERSDIGTVQDFKFSPGGRFLVVQNSKGKLPVYRLGHGLRY